jgi:hypothetical protein
MASPSTDSAAARLDALERQVADLRRRLASLEARLGQGTGGTRVDSREEHPLDRDAVKEKVVFDWQS